MIDQGAFTPRHQRVLAARAAGRTYAAIARALGVSTERVRQIESTARRRQQRAQTAWGVLPVRVGEVLRRAGHASPAEAWALPDADLLAIPQFGPACLAALRRAQSSGGDA